MMEYEQFKRQFIIDETKSITEEEFLRYVMKQQNKYSLRAFGHIMDSNHELGELYSKLKEELENVEFLMKEIHSKEQEFAQ